MAWSPCMATDRERMMVSASRRWSWLRSRSSSWSQSTVSFSSLRV